MPQTPAQIEAPSAAATATGQEPGAEKRRGPRLDREIPIVVSGADTLGQPFHENVKTLSISCYGCKFSSRNYIPKGSMVSLEIRRETPRAGMRVFHGRVIWVQRPRNHREMYQVAMELEIPGNIWGIADPPEGWFAHPDDLKAVASQISAREAGTVAQDTGREVIPAGGPATAARKADKVDDIERPSVAATPNPTALPASSVIGAPARSSEASAGSPDRSLAIAPVPPTTGQADSVEIVFTREQLDGEIEEAIARTIKLIAERIAGAAVHGIVQEATEAAMARIAKARLQGRAAAESLDAKIRQALDEALAESQPPAAALAASSKRKRTASKPRRTKPA